MEKLLVLCSDEVSGRENEIRKQFGESEAGE